MGMMMMMNETHCSGARWWESNREMLENRIGSFATIAKKHCLNHPSLRPLTLYLFRLLCNICMYLRWSLRSLCMHIFQTLSRYILYRYKGGALPGWVKLATTLAVKILKSGIEWYKLYRLNKAQLLSQSSKNLWLNGKYNRKVVRIAFWRFPSAHLLSEYYTWKTM